MAYRQDTLKEYGESCTVCGSTSNVVAHHIDGDRSNNVLDNLVTMCRSCHSKVHSGAEGFEEWAEKLSGGGVDDTGDVAVEIDPTPPQAGRDDAEIPWVYTRDNVKQNRDMVQFYLREFVQDLEGDLTAAVEHELGRNVSLTDVREAAYVAAMRDPEIVAAELERWGFESG